MLSKSKIFNCSSLRQASFSLKNIYTGDYAINVNGVRSALLNRFCTVAEPLNADALPTADESPELPDWVKSSGEEAETEQTRAKRLKNDDFVPPSVSYWIENHKIHAQDVDMKSVVNDIVETDIDKVSEILKNHHFESPDSVVKALEGCDVNVFESLVEQVLRRFSCDWIPAFGFFKWAEMRKGSTHSAHLYNLMVDNLGRARKFDVMWELVGEMKSVEGYVTLNTITKIVRRLARAGKYDDAVEVFEKMEVYGVEKDITARTMVMDALVKQGSVEHAERLHLDYMDRIPPNLSTYNVLVHAWCKTRQMEKAKKMIDEMKELGFSPNAVTYTSVIESYCRERDFRKVEATLEEMKGNGVQPSVVTYTIIMNALSKARETDKALQIYEQMKQKECAPDAAFYNVFIQALGQAGRLRDSDAVFEDMLRQGVSPNTGTYNTLILMAANRLEEEKALKMLRKMEEEGCKPDRYTYAPLLKMCCILNRMKVLSFLLSHMFKNDVGMELGTYSMLVNRLCRNGRLDRAFTIFQEMLRKGFVPMDCTYQILVQGLERKGMLQEKQQLQELMSQPS
ncbi:pentatricopeptide repeat-containing protein At3g22670, mitochondrial-like [Salvia miltiorrhiza]|uniref:pentatricopeptide repeat-containing protein At3g22670, mitochondrial-like n=1 Tax=Salvia miltiorrhiza TaxID=226208 RepID=UPI0025AD3FCC|nr:pentatricopeptide repeat-containing protein At3g22670, mitochondrial-like [Salvia miltiorrhiza]